VTLSGSEQESWRYYSSETNFQSWASKKCEHKKVTILTAGHHYTEERNLICEEGRIRVPYNRYNEVEGIYVK
jgi:hypothetical protein